MLKRIIYINKEGERMDIIARVLKRKSKIIIIKTDDCDCEIPLPRGSVEEISDKLINNDEEDINI